MELESNEFIERYEGDERKGGKELDSGFRRNGEGGKEPDKRSVIPAKAGIHKGEEGMDSPAKPENDKLLNEADLPPEFCRYRDEGCELADSCLECPFPGCIYDERGGKLRWLRRKRGREVFRLHTSGGKNVNELSKMFGISERTVQRDLKMVRGTGKSKKRPAMPERGKKRGSFPEKSFFPAKRNEAKKTEGESENPQNKRG